MRLLADIPDRALEQLAELARSRGLSRAEIIRLAIADFLARQRGAAMEGAFGLWGDSAGDGLEHQRRVRDD